MFFEYLWGPSFLGCWCQLGSNWPPDLAPKSTKCFRLPFSLILEAPLYLSTGALYNLIGTELFIWLSSGCIWFSYDFIWCPWDLTCFSYGFIWFPYGFIWFHMIVCGIYFIIIINNIITLMIIVIINIIIIIVTINIIIMLRALASCCYERWCYNATTVGVVMLRTLVLSW